MKKILLPLLLFVTQASFAARWIIETKIQLNPEQRLLLQKRLKASSISEFYPGSEGYFSRLLSVETDLEKNQIIQLENIENVEPVIEIKAQSLLPSENPTSLVADELFSYQWALLNEGQVLMKEQDDIHNLPLKGIVGNDIGWNKLLAENLKPEKSLIVAVVDSGVDIKHPDLQGQLWKNQLECESTDKNIDADKNGLPGDCDGWNFTLPLDDIRSKSPQDTGGHGTHVAGIIAAAQNEMGIVGVAPFVKIMPIKVIRDSGQEQKVATSEAFAQGVIYAVNNGARVINLSLGWPRALETKYLREAIQGALSRGVVVVAAAGNNSSSEPIFPCAYVGVICVGAQTLDGEFAGFSNFGSHVDTLAPGEGILSTYPIDLDTELFPVPGYDLLSGTSQASPIVAGLIAALLTKENISTNEILGRLYQNGGTEKKDKYSLGASLTWEQLNKKVTTSMIRPVFKVFRQLVYRATQKDGSMTIHFRNYAAPGAATVRVESLSEAIEVTQSEFDLGGLNFNQPKEIKVPVKMNNLNGESIVKFKVTVVSDEGEKSFIAEIPVVRDITQEQEFSKVSFTYTDKKIPLAAVKDGEIVPLINTIPGTRPNSTHEFFMKRAVEGVGLELTVFRRTQDGFSQLKNKILIPKGANLVNFFRYDLNFDGIEDYFLQAVGEDESGKKSFIFAFYNQELNPLWASMPLLYWRPDVNLDRVNEFRFVKVTHKKLGTFAMPVFHTVGELAALDQSQDPWKKPDRSRRPRLYQLLPTDDLKAFELRTLTSPTWAEALKKKLNLKWYESVSVEQMLTASREDITSGQMRVLLSIGYNTKRAQHVFTFHENDYEMGAGIPQLVVQTDAIESLFSVDEDGLNLAGETFLNIYDRARARLIMTEGDEQTGELVYKHPVKTDFLLGHLVSFKTKDQYQSVLQTRNDLVLVTKKDGVVTTDSRAKLRFSFLTQSMLSELYYPVMLKREEAALAALYVDSTTITGNRVYLIELQNEKLVASTKNSLIVPQGCRAVNPVFDASVGTTIFNFVCLENQEWVIRQFPMN